MTDEEIDRMADNFVNAQDFTRVYSVARKAECGAFWEYGFLAGLKAGRPEWHKVADGDLPPTSGEMHAERYPILACTKNGYVTVAIRRKHGRAYEWFCSDYDGNTLYLDKEVIAWCEIPKYTEA